MKKFIISFLLLSVVTLTYSQNEEAVDAVKEERHVIDSLSGDIVKSGWTFGPLPVIAFDADQGLQYGALVNFFYYGDEGIRYPDYDHSLYLEWSRYTKGSGINRIAFDSRTLIPGVRLTTDLSYLTEKALNFYGFNGYEVAYMPEWEDDTSADYISRMFYRHERKMFRFMADFQGKLAGDNLLWYGGINISHIKVATVDIEHLNEGKDPEDILPDTNLLYDKYVEWGLIEENEAEGGYYNYISGGLVWDSRDNEACPMSGIWSEVVFRAAPGFLGNGDYGNLKIAITHRQYFTIIPRNLSFAYRLGFQSTIAGDASFYSQPLMAYSFYKGVLSQGLGGGKTIRGVLRNRVIGDAFIYGNFEFRWKIIHTQILNQNIYIALNGFFDTGKTLREYDIDKSSIDPADLALYFDQENDSFHNSAGGGIRFALNQNFIVAVDYGVSLDKRDGTSGMYIGLNYLF
ncbi:MAG: BamA/TamA family outer membrane protein [Bacteroidota bacterium]|nr:BamA/TamA family outer membrane protein [Bacteroidota bacterium]